MGKNSTNEHSGWDHISRWDGKYAVSWDIIRHILKWHWTSSLMVSPEMSKKKPIDKVLKVDFPSSDLYSKIMDPVTKRLTAFSEIFTDPHRLLNQGLHVLPNTVMIDVDWEKINSLADTRSKVDFEKYKERIIRKRTDPGLENAIKSLVHLQKLSHHNKMVFRKRMKDCSEHNKKEITQSLRAVSAADTGTKLVRDVCGDVVCTLAAGMGGAAGLAWLAGGSAFTGVGKYEDTHNLSAAVVTGVGKFAFSLIPGEKATAGEKVVLFVLHTDWDASEGMLEGKSYWEGLVNGAGSVLIDETVLSKKTLSVVTKSGLAKKIFLSHDVKHILSRVAVPMKVKTLVNGVKAFAPELTEDAKKGMKEIPKQFKSEMVNHYINDRKPASGKTTQKHKAKGTIVAAPTPIVPIIKLKT